MNRLTRVAVGLLFAGAAIGIAAFSLFPKFRDINADTLAVAEVVTPPVGKVRATLVLLSDDDGYGLREQLEARYLALKGAIVIGLDTPKTLAIGDRQTDDCVYFVSDIEQVSQDSQRALGVATYHSPVIAGSGLGGTFALGLAAQSPDATIGRTIAVDPVEALPITKELCSGAPHRRDAANKGWIYDLQPQPLPDPIDVYLTSARDGPGTSHVDDLIKAGFAINRFESAKSADGILLSSLGRELTMAGDDGSPLSQLPLTPIPADPKADTMAIIISGDGGWRDIDAEIGKFLAASGVPVVGVDSLRYFWSEVAPEEAARDFKDIIDTYKAKWHVNKVVLIGYSFGADAMPIIYNALPAAEKASVTQITLAAYTGARQLEIKVSGILGGKTDPNAPTSIGDLQKIPGAIVQCIYGTQDDESACQRVSLKDMELISHPGGHHFDDNYRLVADDILKRIMPAQGS